MKRSLVVPIKILQRGACWCLRSIILMNRPAGLSGSSSAWEEGGDLSVEGNEVAGEGRRHGGFLRLFLGLGLGCLLDLLRG